MTLSIDTNVFIALIRGRNPMVRERFRRALSGDEPVVASLIVEHELLYGAETHPRSQTQRESVGLLLAQVTVQPFDAHDIAAAAQIRAWVKPQGLSIGAYDALIAGQALARNWTVVTANMREFARIDRLNVIDWAVAAD